MFVDYYSILDINEFATVLEVKAAFRKKAIKWHPDRNPGSDTTVEMQRINEAYLILKDVQARAMFDIEYQKFKRYKRESESTNAQASGESNESKFSEKDKEEQTNRTDDYADYAFDDEILKNWMNNARKQSVNLAKQTVDDFKGMMAVGLKEGLKGSGQALVGQIVVSIIVLIIISSSKSCH